MAFFGTHTGSVNLGGASTFISSSNGSSVEIGAATQVLILSGGGSTSLDPRNFADVNFFVSGTPNSQGTTARGTALFGGDLYLSGAFLLNGSIRSNPAQYWYLQNTYPTNPIISFTGLQGNPYLSTEIRSSNIYLGYTNGRTRVGSQLQSPSAHLHITSSGGAVGYAPLKLDSGSLLATPEAGAIEFDARSFYLTTGTTRQNILTTNNGALIGTDTFFFVSGTTGGTKDTSAGKMTVFGGAVVLSSSLMGGYNSFIGSSSLDQVAQRFIIKGTQAGITTVGTDAFFTISGSGGSKGTTNRGTTVVAGDFHISGNTYIGNVVESLALTGSSLTGVLTFNMAGQSAFHVKGASGNITANFTNVPTFEGSVISPTVILSQSAAAAYIISAVQIGGVAQTLLWANGVTPTGNTSKHDVFGFSLIRSGSSWTTLGQMSTYG